MKCQQSVARECPSFLRNRNRWKWPPDRHRQSRESRSREMTIFQGLQQQGGYSARRLQFLHWGVLVQLTTDLPQHFTAFAPAVLQSVPPKVLFSSCDQKLTFR